VSFGIILPHRWTRQPQVPVEVSPTGIGAGIQFCPLFSVSVLQSYWDASPLHNLVTVAGTPTGIVREGIVGRGFDFHPAGGIYGANNARTPSGYVDNAGNWTAVWIGCQLASDFGYGGAIYRGVSSDSIRVGFTSATNARLTWIDQSPAGYDTDLTIPTITVGYGNFYCLAARKVGGTRYLYFKPFFGGALASTSASTGLSTGRADTAVGWGLGNSNQTAHNNTIFAGGWGRALSEGEIREVFANPWQIFRPIQRRIYVPSAGVGGGVTVAPTSGAVNFTGQAPSLTIPVTLAPITRSVQFSGQTPTITIPLTVAPSSGSVAFSGQTPTLTIPVGIAPSSGTVAFAGQAPTLSIPLAITPTGGTISFTGGTPVLDLGDGSVTAAPTAGQIAFTGQAPTLTIPVTLSPTSGAIAFTGNVPTVDAGGGVTLSPFSGSVEFTGQAPSLTIPLSIDPTSGAITFSGGAPTLTGVGSGAISLSEADIAAIIAAMKADTELHAIFAAAVAPAPTAQQNAEAVLSDPRSLTVPKFLALK
jgi:hypothetical protein